MWAVAVAGGNCYYNLWGGEYYRAVDVVVVMMMMLWMMPGMGYLRKVGWSRSHDLKVA